MIKKEITIKLLFGALQSLLGLIIIFLSAIIKANFFWVQNSLNLSIQTSNFFVVILLAIGSISIIGGLLLVYDWWQS